MKKIMFWCLFPLTAVLFVLFTILEGLSSQCVEFLHLWESGAMVSLKE